MTECPVTSYAVYVINGTHSTCIQFYEHGKDRGAIRFVPNDENPEDAKLDSDGKIILNMRINRLHPVLDIIRHEKPLYLFYADGKNAGLRSGRETIGDDQIWLT
ncbi:MAG: hypothetical protein JYX80_14715 [Candidatus Scalindua sediminis]|nr:hypothetical protein [Candidatus Scalindua sediminis]